MGIVIQYYILKDLILWPYGLIFINTTGCFARLPAAMQTLTTKVTYTLSVALGSGGLMVKLPACLI